MIVATELRGKLRLRPDPFSPSLLLFSFRSPVLLLNEYPTFCLFNLHPLARIFRIIFLLDLLSATFFLFAFSLLDLLSSSPSFFPSPSSASSLTFRSIWSFSHAKWGRHASSTIKWKCSVASGGKSHSVDGPFSAFQRGARRVLSYPPPSSSALVRRTPRPCA